MFTTDFGAGCRDIEVTSASENLSFPSLLAGCFSSFYLYIGGHFPPKPPRLLCVQPSAGGVAVPGGLTVTLRG